MSDLRSEEGLPLNSETLFRLRSLGVRTDAEAISELVTALDQPGTNQYAAAILAQSSHPEAVQGLLTGLRHRDWKVRAICAGGLTQAHHPVVLPALLAALNDEAVEVVEEACSALASIEDPRAMEPLRGLLSHPDWRIRCAAVDALLDFGVLDTALTDTLEQLEVDPESQNADHGLPRARRLERIRGRLSTISGAATGAADLAADLRRSQGELIDPDPATRAAAVNRLRGVPGPASLSLLLQAFDDPSPRVRGSVALSLRWKETTAAFEALVRHLREDPTPHVRQMCAFSLGRDPDPRTLEPLIDALADGLNRGDWKLTQVCAQALGELADVRAVPKLFEALQQSRWSARCSAARALLALKVADERLVCALEQLTNEPEAAEWNLSAAESVRDLSMMREYAVEAGDPEPRALPTLEEMLDQARHLLQTAGRSRN